MIDALCPSRGGDFLETCALRAREHLLRVRRGQEPSGLAYSVTNWPDAWLAAALTATPLVQPPDVEFGLPRLLVLPGTAVHAEVAVTTTTVREVVEHLERAAVSDGAERVTALEAAWRVLPIPDLADVFRDWRRDRSCLHSRGHLATRSRGLRRWLGIRMRIGQRCGEACPPPEPAAAFFFARCP